MQQSAGSAMCIEEMIKSLVDFGWCLVFMYYHLHITPLASVSTAPKFDTRENDLLKKSTGLSYTGVSLLKPDSSELVSMQQCSRVEATMDFFRMKRRYFLHARNNEPLPVLIRLAVLEGYGRWMTQYTFGEDTAYQYIIIERLSKFLRFLSKQ